MESILPFESANSIAENRRYHFFSSCRDASKTITFHNGLTPTRAEKPKLFFAEKSNKCYRRITETLKENLFYERRAFYRLNQRILPKRTGDIIFSVLAVTPQIR